MTLTPETSSYDLFLAVPMSSFPPEEYQALRTELLAALKKWKTHAPRLRVFCAMDGISEPINFDDPEKGRQMDCDAIKASKHFAAIYPRSVNSGMTFEAGIAYAHGIPMTLFCRNDQDLPFIMRKMPGTKLYNTIPDVIQELENIVSPRDIASANTISR